jgi:pimeloyl-ACP methyl ester carboxylesterase
MRPIPTILTVLVLLATPAWSQSAANVVELPREGGGATRVHLSGERPGCPDTIVLSHGFGGDPARGGALAAHLAAAGWRVAAIAHAESGPPALRRVLFAEDRRAALVAAATDPAAHAVRRRDLHAALAFLTRECRPRRLVLAGHSMGAMTTMIEAGATPRFGGRGQDRFDAYVAISPQGIGSIYAPGAFARVTKPVLMITGTRDEGMDGDWTTRLSAYEALPAGQKRLAILDGAGHLALGGNRDPVAATLARLIDAFARGSRATMPGVSQRDG